MNKLFKTITFISGLMISAQIFAAALSEIPAVRAARAFIENTSMPAKWILCRGQGFQLKSQNDRVNPDCGDETVVNILHDPASYHVYEEGEATLSSVFGFSERQLKVGITNEAAKKLFVAEYAANEELEGQRLESANLKAQLELADLDLAQAQRTIDNLYVATTVATLIAAGASRLAVWLWFRK